MAVAHEGLEGALTGTLHGRAVAHEGLEGALTGTLHGRDAAAGATKKKAVTPEAACGAFSTVTFSWLSPLLRQGARQPLRAADLYGLADQNKADALLRIYDADSRGAARGEAWRLWRAVVRGPLLRSVPPMLLFMGCQVAQPLLLHGTVTAVRQRSSDGLWYALAILLVTAVGSCANQAQLHVCFRVGQRLRALTTANVVRHVLSLPLSVRRGVPTGELVNLVTSDAQKLYEVLQQAHLLWAAPLQIAIIAVLLVRLIGPAALLGIAYLALGAPLSRRIVALQKRVRQRRMPLSDRRVGLCSETLRGVRTVKSWHWEAPFARRVLEARQREAPLQRYELFWWAWSMVVVVTAPTIAMGLTFTLVTMTGRVLSAADAFAAILFLNNIKFPMMFVGQCLSTIAQSSIALRRLGVLLGRTAPPPVAHPSTADDGSVISVSEGAKAPLPCVELSHATFSLTAAAGAATEGVFCLRQITLAVSPGELVMVVGAVGAGKTTLLHAMLGELQLAAGGGRAALRAETVGYAAQSPFVLSATVRQNILFGHPFDAEKYAQVIDACALRRDLAVLPSGDATAIGERGVTLSGGQRWRISLARVAYARPELVLLDDPLSALDAHVGKEVFEGLISSRSGLLGGAARVLVTHATQYIGLADRIIAMHDGRVVFSGTFEQLVAGAAARGKGRGAKAATDKEHSFLDSLARSVQECAPVAASEGDVNDDGKASSTPPAAAQAAAGPAPPPAPFSQVASLVAEEQHPDGVRVHGHQLPHARPGEHWYLRVYLAIVAVNAIFVVSRSHWFSRAGWRASQRIFQQLLCAVLRAPQTFFDSHPFGRIINRFSFDTEVIDYMLVVKICASIISFAWFFTALDLDQFS
eukprot:g6564.t1